MPGLMDLDIAFLEPNPSAPEEDSNIAGIAKFEKWKRTKFDDNQTDSFRYHL